MDLVKIIRQWFTKEEKKRYEKLDDYEYAVIEELVKVDITYWEIAMVLGISDTRAKYEVTQAKERLKNARSKSK